MNNLIRFYDNYSKTNTFRENYDSSLNFEKIKPDILIDFDKHGNYSVNLVDGDGAELTTCEAISSKSPKLFFDGLRKTIGKIEKANGEFHFIEDNFWVYQPYLIKKVRDFLTSHKEMFKSDEYKEALIIIDIVNSFYGNTEKYFSKFTDKEKLSVSKIEAKENRNIINARKTIVKCLNASEKKVHIPNNVCFCYCGQPIFEYKSVKKLVENFRMDEIKNSSIPFSKSRTCPCCGKPMKGAPTVPFGYVNKSIVGGMTNGCASISYNEEQFSSFGYEGNQNAGICYECGRKITRSIEILGGIGLQFSTITDDDGNEKPIANYIEDRFRMPLRKSKEYAVLAYAVDANGKVRIIKDLFGNDDDDICEADLGLDVKNLRVPFLALNSHDDSDIIIPNSITATVMIISSNMGRMVIRDMFNIDLYRLMIFIKEFREATKSSKIYYPENSKKGKIVKHYPTINNMLNCLGAFGPKGKDFYPGIAHNLMMMMFHGIRENPNFKNIIIKNIISNFISSGNNKYFISNDLYSMVRFVYNAGRKEEDKMSYILDENNEKPSYLLGRAMAQASSCLYFASSSEDKASKNDLSSQINSMFSQFMSSPSVALARAAEKIQYYTDKAIKSGDKGIGSAIFYQTSFGELCTKLMGKIPIFMSPDDRCLFIGGYWGQRLKNQSGKPDTTTDKE